MDHGDYFTRAYYRQSIVAVPATGWALVVPADPNRVSLIVGNPFSGLSAVFSLNANDFPGAFGVFNMLNVLRLDLEFPIHGPLVCQEWYASDSAAAGGNLYVLEQLLMPTNCGGGGMSTDPYGTTYQMNPQNARPGNGGQINNVISPDEYE